MDDSLARGDSEREIGWANRCEIGWANRCEMGWANRCEIRSKFGGCCSREPRRMEPWKEGVGIAVEDHDGGKKADVWSNGSEGVGIWTRLIGRWSVRFSALR